MVWLYKPNANIAIFYPLCLENAINFNMFLLMLYEIIYVYEIHFEMC